MPSTFDLDLSLELVLWEEPEPLKYRWKNSSGDGWSPMISWIFLESLVSMVGTGTGWNFLIVERIREPGQPYPSWFAQCLGSSRAIAVELGWHPEAGIENLWRIGLATGGAWPLVNVHSDPTLQLMVQPRQALSPPSLALTVMVDWLADGELADIFVPQRVRY
ncbi:MULTISPECIES: hypothetical protein [unclassified Cryobacterium]|uniref:hypothetical protein n=1 Tax=unclassified Cryobacterium TaxID=2649013 RepID=UPI002AB5BD48|nr:MULTISPECIES: hypothetical protein [unclassified Cryobacterium]MDY7528418.1 hypothetical protein [Cryobacterium sp. 10C2]MDY7540866.1 hypothetical protein [Cryobacterium sp. 5B3]MDY7555835.1 hypothetical protein [Cryobacterium sp. 10C3]MEA9999830.1 hypothetical protein [Cryobacterium sp. RTS3]MEB0003839.1 hypothetical protein [Cryobacterium sp. RTC2.1]